MRRTSRRIGIDLCKRGARALRVCDAPGPACVASNFHTFSGNSSIGFGAERRRAINRRGPFKVVVMPFPRVVTVQRRRRHLLACRRKCTEHRAQRLRRGKSGAHGKRNACDGRAVAGPPNMVNPMILPLRQPMASQPPPVGTSSSHCPFGFIGENALLFNGVGCIGRAGRVVGIVARISALVIFHPDLVVANV